MGGALVEFIDSEYVFGGYVSEDNDTGAVGYLISRCYGACGKWVGMTRADLVDVVPGDIVHRNVCDREGIVLSVYVKEYGRCFWWDIVW